MGPTAKSLVLDLLSVMKDADAPVSGLVFAGELFGISGGSTRVALTRQLAAGLVESPRRGVYRLAPRAHALRDQVGTWRHLERSVRTWDGGWVGVATTQQSRALRLLGLEVLEPGLALRPDNLRGGVAGVRERLLALDVDAPVFRVSELDDARRERALSLWDVRRLEQGYAAMLARLAEVAAALPDMDDREAARASFIVGGDAIRLLIFDPLLPPPLVDVDLRNEVVAAMRRFDRQGRAAWQRLFRPFDAASFGVGPSHGSHRRPHP
jgi:phenylacetic acid degradation operon negative regulatory protein